MISSAIMAGGAILGSLLTALFNRSNASSAQKFSKSENELAYQRSLPSTQVQNIKAAGLNPNLIYTNMQAASYEPTQAQRTEYDFSGLGSHLGSAMQLGFNREEQKKRLQGIDLDNRNKELNNLFVESTLLDRIEQQGLKTSESRAKIANNLLDLKLKDAKAKLTHQQSDALDMAIKKTQSEIVNLAKLGELRDLEVAEKKLTLELNTQLKPYGITVSDPLLARLLVIHLLPRLLDYFDQDSKTGVEIPADANLRKRAEQFLGSPETNFSTHLRR